MLPAPTQKPKIDTGASATASSTTVSFDLCEQALLRDGLIAFWLCIDTTQKCDENTKFSKMKQLRSSVNIEIMKWIVLLHSLTADLSRKGHLYVHVMTLFQWDGVFKGT